MTAVAQEQILTAHQGNVETQASVSVISDKVKSIVSQFVDSNGASSAACASAAFYLQSFPEFADPTHEDLENRAHVIHAIATDLGCDLKFDADQLASTVIHEFDQRDGRPWHKTLDAAVWDARHAMMQEYIPPEVVEACHHAGIRSRKGLFTVLVIFALHQRCGDDWFLSRTALPQVCGHHGLAGIVNKDSIRHTMRSLKDAGVIIETVPYTQPSGGDGKCAKYRWSLVADETVESVALDQGVDIDLSVKMSNINYALRSLYSGALPFPSSGMAALAEPSQGSLFPLKKTHRGQGNHIGGNVPERVSGRLTWDKDKVLEACVGKQSEIVKKLACPDLKTTTSQKYSQCPKCKVDKKCTVFADGNFHCFKCESMGNILNVMMDLTGETLSDTVNAIGEHLGLKPHVFSRFRSQRSAPVIEPRTKADPGQLLQQVADARGLTTEALLHYGAEVTELSNPAKWGEVKEFDVVRVPMRDDSMEMTSYLDLGFGEKYIEGKGRCPRKDDGFRTSFYIPNDFGDDPGNQVVIHEGAKDTMAAWADDTSRNHVGIHSEHIPIEMVECLARLLKGRQVVLRVDCSRSARRAAQSNLTKLQRHGVNVSIYDPDPSRDDGGGYRETGRPNELEQVGNSSLIDWAATL